MPDVFLRTSLISGFPGETKQMHDECVEFVKEVQFDRLGVFPYSAEEGTPAASYDGQVPEETKRAYADEIMEASQYVILRKMRNGRKNIPGHGRWIFAGGKYICGKNIR